MKIEAGKTYEYRGDTGVAVGPDVGGHYNIARWCVNKDGKVLGLDDYVTEVAPKKKYRVTAYFKDIGEKVFLVDDLDSVAVKESEVLYCMTEEIQ